jgi:hypothetical protein
MIRPSTYAVTAAEAALIAVDAYTVGGEMMLPARAYRECEPKEAVREMSAKMAAHATAAHQLTARVPATIVATIAK